MTRLASTPDEPRLTANPLAEAADIAGAIIEHEARAEGVAPMEVETAASTLPIALPVVGVGEAEAIDRLRRVVMATPTTTGPRFFNQLFAGRERVATIAEALTVVLNSSMYTYKVAGPQVLIEREVLQRMQGQGGHDRRGRDVHPRRVDVEPGCDDRGPK